MFALVLLHRNYNEAIFILGELDTGLIYGHRRHFYIRCTLIVAYVVFMRTLFEMVFCTLASRVTDTFSVGTIVSATVYKFFFVQIFAAAELFGRTEAVVGAMARELPKRSVKNKFKFSFLHYFFDIMIAKMSTLHATKNSFFCAFVSFLRLPSARIFES